MNDESNLRRKVHKHNCKKQQLDLKCYSVLGVFKNGGLGIIENDKEFIGNEIIEEEVKGLSEDVMQGIKNKEANVATDAPEKYEHVVGAWTIEDKHKIERRESELWSNKWMQNAAIAGEETMLFDLVTKVVKT